MARIVWDFFSMCNLLASERQEREVGVGSI
jgi:hypothetical protein